MDLKNKRWFYNPEDKKWYHTSGATSDNPPDVMPDPVKLGTIEGLPNPKPEDCGCGKKGKRNVK